MIKRNETKQVKVKNLILGGNDKVYIQSMLTTKPRDYEKCIKKIRELEEIGCEIIRVAVLNYEDINGISKIVKEINIPLVADIHFDYRLALGAIDAGVNKIRLNPGNIEKQEHIEEVVNKCLEHDIPIRIGVNSGSLPKDLKEKYGAHNPKALVESAKRHVKILEKLNFYNIVISLKASDIDTTIKSYELAAKTFKYPLHLGLTESGTEFSGTIKSSIALGNLLYQGIGSTIRISLSADPKDEIRVAKQILSSLGIIKRPKLVSCPTCGRCEFDLIKVANKLEKELENIEKDITVAVMGCVVNGPGEASDADIGVAGASKEAILFKHGKKIRRIESKNIVKEVLKEIEKM